MTLLGALRKGIGITRLCKKEHYKSQRPTGSANALRYERTTTRLWKHRARSQRGALMKSDEKVAVVGPEIGRWHNQTWTCDSGLKAGRGVGGGRMASGPDKASLVLKSSACKQTFSGGTNGTDEVSWSYLNPELKTFRRSSDVTHSPGTEHDVNHILACEELMHK